MNPVSPVFDLGSVAEYDFLSDCELFVTLPDTILQAIFRRGKLVTYPPGTELFAIGAPSDTFQVIKAGTVEIRRLGDKDELVPVAYLGPGDSLGEMTMLTGTGHTSAARLPEGGVLFELSQGGFRGILETYPEFAVRLCLIFAQRLESTVKNLRIQRTRQFHGHLKFFDLATVIQTIITSRMTGTLVVTDDLGANYAEIFFNTGDIVSARLGHLTGPQAFFQLFQPPPTEGTFDFKSGEAPERNVPSETNSFQPGMNMLMEAVRMQDELEQYRPQINLEAIYQPQANELRWEGEEDFLLLANDIWYRLHAERQPVVQLLQEVPACHFAVHHVLVALKNGGQIA